MTPRAAHLQRTIACHCLSVRRTARAITRMYDDRLRMHGLRATQFTILAALSLGGRTPLTALAELLGLERTSLTRSASVMERNGWIETLPSEDARERLLRATREGRRVLEAAYPAWLEAQELVESGEWTPPPGLRETLSRRGVAL